jgi:hypothetical protein
MATADDQFQQWLTQVSEQWASTGIGYVDEATRAQLKQIWDAASDKGALLKELQQRGAGPDQLLPWVQQQATQLQQQQTQAAQQPAQPQGTTTTGAGGQSVAVPKLGDPYDPSKANYAQVGAIGYTGTSDPASLAAMVGQDATAFQNEYNDYLKHRQQIIDAQRNSGLPVEAPRGLSMGQFAQSKAFAMQGQWQPLLDALDYSWNEQYGQRLPPDLRMQVLDALGKMDANQQQAVLSAEAQYVTGLMNARGQPTGIAGALASLGGTLLAQVPAHIGNLTTQYATAHPQISTEVAKDAQVRQQGYIQWLQGHNIPVTQTLLDQLGKMTAATSSTNPEPGSDYAMLLAMPSDIKGMTWQSKEIAMGNIGSQWRQWFGREPNAQELQWAAGRNPTEIQDFIDNSPSHVPGVTIRRYQDYVDFINKMGTGSQPHAFSAGIDDSLIHDLHQQLTSSSTQAAAPSPLPAATSTPAPQPASA